MKGNDMQLTLTGFFIALEIWGAVFALLVAFCVYIIGGIKETSEKWMLWLLIATAVLLSSDAPVWLLDGRPGMRVHDILVITNFILYMMSYTVLGLFTMYVRSLSGDSVFVRPILVLLSAGCVMTIVNLFNRGIYYIDDANVYHRGAYFIISQLAGFIAMLCLLLFIFGKRKSLGRRRFAVLILYLSLPMIALCIQAFHYGIPLENSAVAISAVISFTVLILEQRRDLIQQQEEIVTRDMKLARERELVDDMKIRLIISQIKPHFMFNVLNSIYYLIGSSPSKAQAAIDSFSDYLRGNMAALESRGCIPFVQEMEHVKSYLRLEEMRFQDDLKVIYDIKTLDFELPAFSVEPIVENAVKHGVGKKEDGGYVRIVSEETDDGYMIRIEDDGVGFDIDDVQNDGKLHVGIANVRKRIETIVGGTLTIDSGIGKGTCVTIFIPKNQTDME